MSSNPFKKLTNLTNELAKERNRAAAERTLTSWIQNCLSLIGFGIAFDRIFSALHQAFPDNSTVINARWTHIIGLSVIALGIFLLIIAIFIYLVAVQSLKRNDYLYRPIRSYNLMTITVGSIILFGLVSLIAVFIVIAWG
ncbi:YidH family protein [Nostoc sp. MG11]|uniref:YidH family protein n=1 Tax=Nostoc sp. MG11 TaxID=2721166 RepID=UPI00186658DF|nr:DUF202 domain-containing protein [Nostoc sp. MG11]